MSAQARAPGLDEPDSTVRVTPLQIDEAPEGALIVTAPLGADSRFLPVRRIHSARAVSRIARQQGSAHHTEPEKMVHVTVQRR